MHTFFKRLSAEIIRFDKLLIVLEEKVSITQTDTECKYAFGSLNAYFGSLSAYFAYSLVHPVQFYVNNITHDAIHHWNLHICVSISASYFVGPYG